MSFRITPEDVGRRAIDGMRRVYTITEFDLSREFPVKATLMHKGTVCDTDFYTLDGKWGTEPTKLDLVAWADEPATDQPRPKDLRDEFAMVALQGLVSDPSSGYQYVSPQSYEDGVAKRAYELADAMIRARGK